MSFDYFSKRRMQYFLEKIKDKLDLKENKIWTGTQAEYEAQASQIADGTVVQITDDEKAITFIEAEEIYSTDERMVGVSTDGKPIYKKSYITTTNVTLGTSWSSVVFTVADAEKPIKAELIRYTGSDYTTYPIGCNNNSGFKFVTFTGSVNCQAGSIFTVWYTKTTDIAGSGDFVPSGAPAVHYSTDEQVVGTWIGGSTLYQKTIIFEGKNKSTGSTVLISGTDLLNTYGINIGNIKKKEFLVEYSPTGYPTMILTTDLYLDPSDRAVIWSANESLYYAIQWGSASATMDIILTLQYTKTS